MRGLDSRRPAGRLGTRARFRSRDIPFRPASLRDSGFSLIEVVVAILILGIALVGLTEGITTALGSSKESELQTAAALLAAGRIETLRAEGDYSESETEGDFGKTLPLYQWKQTIRSTDLDGLYDVDVVVQNTQTGKAIYELRTLLFQVPQEAGAGTPGSGAGSKSASSGNRL